MKRAIGMSLEISIGKRFWPSIMLRRQTNTRLRAKEVCTRKLFIDEEKRFEYFDVLTTAEKLGLKIDVHVGRIRRPIRRPGGPNPWTSGNHWFILDSKIPVPSIFVSFFIKIGKYSPGFYIGTKTYRFDGISSPWIRWGKVEEWGNEYLCPSITIRKDMKK